MYALFLFSLPGFNSLFFLNHTFSFVEYDIVSGALICFLI